MKVQLLGTGGADGWPNPFCTCASCAWMRRHGEVRGQTAALVDDRLMLDCGPEAPRAALRLGTTLVGVRTVLLTHAHPDHTGPAALLWRGWVDHPDELVVAGPRPALDLCRPWLGPRDRVRLVELAPGDELAHDGYRVRALAARHGDPSVQPTLLFDVTGSDGARLFYACDTGPLPEATVEALRDAAVDLVLMEETFGDGSEAGHLDLSTFGGQVARLRRVGAVGPDCCVAAVHLGHRNPPPPVLRERLSAWGVTLPDDGTVLAIGPAGGPVAALGSGARPGAAVGSAARPGARRVLVLGGARSGKSSFAESLLAAEPAVTYVATAREIPGDAEWAARLERHRARRPAHWRTVETADLAGTLPHAAGAVLVDCLTLWLADRLGAAPSADLSAGPASSRPATATDAAAGGPADAADTTADTTADTGLAAAVDELVATWRRLSGLVVAVTNEVGSGVVPASAAGRRFRDALGVLNSRLAAESDEVWLVVAGVPRRLA